MAVAPRIAKNWIQTVKQIFYLELTNCRYNTSSLINISASEAPPEYAREFVLMTFSIN